MLQRASEVLFRWCKRLDKAADRVSGASGPFFILVALCLFGVTIVTYFDVVYREAFGGSAWFQFIGAVLSAYIIYSFLFYYYMAIRTSPGRVRIDDRHCSSLNRVQKFLRGKGSSTRRNARKAFKLAQQTTPTLNAQDSNQRTCKKCPSENGRQPAKPERAHHCRVCQTCILGYEYECCSPLCLFLTVGSHHCPWIHNCVGVNNSRYFVLFMIALALACFTNIILGRRFGKWTLDLTYSWSKYNTPRICTLLLMVLSLVIGIAMLIMAGWQLLLISRGETSVEAQDNEYYRKLLSGRGQTFVNPYDLGQKKNLQAFFNIAPVGEFVWWSILVPIPLPPTTDGYQWHKSVIRDTGNNLTWEDELTDEDD